MNWRVPMVFCREKMRGKRARIAHGLHNPLPCHDLCRLCKLCRFSKGEKMPRTRWTLTRTEKNEYIARAKWLASNGAAVEISEPTLSQPRGLRVSQYGPEFHNIAVNLHPGRVVVIVGVRLLAARTGTTVCDCVYTLPWKGPELFLWNAPEGST